VRNHWDGGDVVMGAVEKEILKYSSPAVILGQVMLVQNELTLPYSKFNWL